VVLQQPVSQQGRDAMVALQQNFGENANKKHRPNPATFGFDSELDPDSFLLQYYREFAPKIDRVE